MKLKFNPDLSYQKQAIESTRLLFEGLSGQTDNAYMEYGIANSLTLNPDKILHNLNQIQQQNYIEKSTRLIDNSDYPFPNFSIEMETGTGKTYVYLRSIFELNKHYGLRKFIIVVPSVAIREGVLASLKMMKPHFQSHYNNLPFDYYVYDSKNLSRVRDFATANTVQIMVINIQAFQRDAGEEVDYTKLSPDEIKKLSVIHREQDRMQGVKPITFIQQMRPVVIIDEPQSVDTTAKAKRAINHLQPLFALRYSATHKNPYNVVYQLGPVKAFDEKLVKQISVASIEAQADINHDLVRLVKIGFSAKAKTPSAEVIIFEDTKQGTKEKKVKLKQGTDLSDYSARDGYRGYVVDEIYAEPGLEYVRFTNNVILEPEQEKEGTQDDVLKEQIRQTIEAHFKKERMLRKLGLEIKVLSLFFIDKVANYRYFDEHGQPQLGKLAQWFEQSYREISAQPIYNELPKRDVSRVHNGYFAEVKKRGKVVDFKDSSGNTASDADVYELIMRDKERLLDENEPLRFIFSHSALKEGWDNPNVFQICTLRELGSEKERRQTLGRGLRLAVNANGDRVHDERVNRLTVIASESFERYAKALQTEMENDIGGDFKFGRVPRIAFAPIAISDTESLGQEKSIELWHALQDSHYLNSAGDLKSKFQPNDLHFSLDIPDEYKPFEDSIIEKMRSFMFEGRIKNERHTGTMKYNKRVELNPEFEALWNKIKHKTRYHLKFSTEELIATARDKINRMDKILPVSLMIDHTETKVSDAGIVAERQLQTTKARFLNTHETLPDLLTALQNQTELTRQTLFEIIKGCKGRLGEFKENPQGFITAANKAILEALSGLLVKDIRYEKIEDQSYSMTQFDIPELQVYLDKCYPVKETNEQAFVKTPYNYVEYDSTVEHKIARAFDETPEVKFFCKLPRWFTVPTPVGDYNPDWAVVLKDDQKLYLVEESKSTHDENKRRFEENMKIICGEAHFKALGVDYRVVTSPAEATSFDF